MRKTWLSTSILGHTNGVCLQGLQLNPDGHVDADCKELASLIMYCSVV